MAIQILNNGDAAVTFRTKLNNNFQELNENKAPISHASSEATYGVGTNNAYGHVKVTPANGLNISNGTITMSIGTTSAAGALQMVNSYTSTSTTLVPTAAALKSGIDSTVKVYSGAGNPSSSLGKNNDIYIKTS